MRCVMLLSIVGCIALLWSLSRSKDVLDRRPGHIVGDFELVDVRTGQLNRLSDHSGELVVLVFTGTSCPVGDLYMPRLSALARRYEARNVNIFAVNSNHSDTPADVADHARRSEVSFPVLKDVDNRVADQLLVERTCESLLIDRRGRLRYRGAIDDQYGLGTRRDNPAHHYLDDAIEAVLAGRDVSPQMTPVVGCPIERKAPPRAARSLSRRRSAAREQTASLDAESKSLAHASPLAVTYAEHVAPILHARCASCHRPGQVAPFSLLTYEQARRWARSIVEVVNDRRMPPWHADPHYGRFSNDRSLSDDNRTQLVAWVEQGTPSGDLARAPAPPRFPQGWSIGTPDAVYDMPVTYLVQAEGTVPIQHFRMKTTHTDDLYIQAAEARPGDRAVVHHICIYINDPKKPTRGNFRNKDLLVAYTPGDMPSVYGSGIAHKFAAGTELEFEVHYTPIGQVRFDRSSVAVIFAKQPPQHLAVTRGIGAYGLKIPPGAPDHIEYSSWIVQRDVHLLSMTPHTHLRGRSFVYTAQYPGGQSEILLSVPAYDFNWQSVYRLAEPKPLPKGTTVLCEAHFDNSPANPANPDPTKTVVWGDQTWDEMMIGFIDYFED
jgi:peroxiredoxin